MRRDKKYRDSGVCKFINEHFEIFFNEVSG